MDIERALNLTITDHKLLFDIMTATEASIQLDPVSREWKLWPRAAYLNSKFCRNLRHVQFLLQTGRDDLLRSVFFAPVDVRHLFQRARFKPKQWRNFDRNRYSDGYCQTDCPSYTDGMCQTEIHGRENHCQTDSPCFTHSSCQTSEEMYMYTRQCFQKLHSSNKGSSVNSADSDASAEETDRESVPRSPMPNNTETYREAGNDEGSVMRDRYKYKAIQMTGNETYIKASRFKHGILQLDTDEDGQDGEHDFGGGGDCQCGDEEEPSLDSITPSWKEYASPIEPRPGFMHLSPVESLQPVSVARLPIPTLELSQSPTFQVPKCTLSEKESTKAFYSYIQNRLANDGTTSRSTVNINSIQMFTYTIICVLSFALFLDVYPTALFE